MNRQPDARRLSTTVTALGLALAVLVVPVPPATGADFTGKTIDWIIPFAAGGGSDVWARIFAPYLSRHLPGQPTVVVRNVPGGGSTIGANQFHQRARPDGLTILGTSGSTQFPYLLDDPRVQYDYRDWIPVLASPTGGVAYLSPKFGVRTLADLPGLRDVELVYGSQGATSLDLVPLLAFEILGLKVKAVFGMRGRGEGRVAFERGEVTVDYQTSSAYLSRVVPLVEAGKAVPLFSWGALDATGNLVRDPTFPDLPHFAEAYEMVHGTKPSGAAFEAWKAFFTAGFAVQKIVVLPGGTPPATVAAWHQAARATVEDPEFKRAAAKELGAYPQVVGEQAAAMVKIGITVDPGAKAWVKSWLTTRYDVKF
jgi:tripartite-type tricarboxylate transporter receptor subunit TctC